ncbi:phospholipase C type enzyme [Toensbergia leucococca]|nr:phospholipase C type enzyme [Toensbergia leucococca]
MDPSSFSPPTSLQILTLNCWGLKYISDQRSSRLSEIAHRLATTIPTPQIVGLQECWTQRDYLAIRHQTQHILPYGKFYHSGIFGGGLAILSKWPIVESSMIRYPLNGRPTAFFRGDWFVGKGVACARIKLGPGRSNTAEVFCTHLHAPYESEPNDSYLCHRTAQAWEIAKLMRGAAERGHLVIGLGDFNMVPLSLAHQLITTHAPVQDVWRVRHPDSSLGSATDAPERARGREIPTVQHSLEKNGATCDSVLNTWRWSKPQQKALRNGEAITIPAHTPDPGAKRLDYIFFGNGMRSSSSEREEPRWEVQDVRVGMTDRHPHLSCSLSDHFSVEATLSRALHPSTPPSTSLPPSTTSNLPTSTYTTILALTATYTQRERLQRRLRLAHFGLSILVSIACLIATWWSPRPFVSFLLMLLSTLGLGAGLLDGLIGGLFVGSEIRALKEFEWEVGRVRDGAGGGGVEGEMEGVEEKEEC